MVSLVVNFRRSVIIAELWRPGRKTFLSIFTIFWKNDPLQQNFQNSVPKVFIATPIDVCSNFATFGHGISVKSCVAYLTKNKTAWLYSFATTRIAHKICQG